MSIQLNHALMQDIDAHLRSPAGNDIGLFTDTGAPLPAASRNGRGVRRRSRHPSSFTVLKGCT
ncbi:MAG: hypothetical protein R3F10_09745 [Lysobacteraceae bacterium]